ncbi:MAG: hypothetical protein Greene041619_934 [Candidatus Peregrinibacteria bacterium Greene0416_19]|nr:MAG: hypothetical protein Greene041619_934 [Candidatus Peregrinibacteria bacterium Greene0416_19]
MKQDFVRFMVKMMLEAKATSGLTFAEKRVLKIFMTD